MALNYLRGLAISVVLIGLASLLGQSAQAQDKKPVLTMFGSEIPGYMMDSITRPGILIELVRKVSAESGYQINYRLVPWPRAMKEASASPNAVIPGLSRLPNREANYTWIEPIIGAKSAFVSLGKKINSFAEGRELSAVGAWRGTSHEQEVKENNIENIFSFNNVKKSIKMIEMGRVKAWYGDVNEILTRWNENAVDKSLRLKFGKVQKVEHIWLAGGKGMPKKVAKDLRLALKKVIKSGFRDEMSLKYFNYVVK